MLELTSDETEQLERWVRRRKSAQALALRSRIVLACATGLTNKEVAAQLGVSMPTVGKWRSRFVESRLDGLVDEPRSGRKPTITAEQVEDVVVATLESTPEHATHWSRKKMAERSGLSKSTIGRIWKGFGLKPHLTDGFKLSNDPLFVDKVYDVVGLYLNPPESAVVLCVDEKSQVQALGRSQPAFPMMPGMPEKRTHDYVRNGTTSLFAAFNTADGTVISSLHRRHRSIEFKKFLAKIDAGSPRRPGRSPDLRQLRHPQESRRENVAGRSPPVPDAFHPNVFQLAQPGRAVLRVRHRRPAPTQPSQQRPATGSRHPRLGQGLEHSPEAFHLDQERRRDPRIPRTAIKTNLRRRTLVQRPEC